VAYLGFIQRTYTYNSIQYESIEHKWVLTPKFFLFIYFFLVLSSSCVVLVFVVLLFFDSFESLWFWVLTLCFFLRLSISFFFLLELIYFVFFFCWNAFKEIIWKEAGSSPLLKLLKLLSLALSNFLEALHISYFLLFQRLS